MSRKVFMSVLALVLAFGLAGCKSVSDKIGEEIGEEIAGGVIGADVEVDGESVTLETEDGSVTMSGTEDTMPADFPSDFPVYKGADVDSTSTIAGDESTDFYVNLYVGDSVKDVYDWYKSELADAGWTIDSDLFMAESGDDSAILTVSKGGTQANIGIGAEDGRSSLTLIVMVKK